MSKKILVLGASGFIGKHAVRKFLASGYNVFAQYLPTENPPKIPETDSFDAMFKISEILTEDGTGNH